MDVSIGTHSSAHLNASRFLAQKRWLTTVLSEALYLAVYAILLYKLRFALSLCVYILTGWLCRLRNFSKYYPVQPRPRPTQHRETPFDIILVLWSGYALPCAA